MDHVLVVIAVPVRFPSKKSMAWTSQMRPAAVSIPSNIAEGKVAFFRQRVVTVAIPGEGFFVGASDSNYSRMRARISEAWDGKKLTDLASESGHLQPAGEPISVVG
jgi:hypothetical protein